MKAAWFLEDPKICSMLILIRQSMFPGPVQNWVVWEGNNWPLKKIWTDQSDQSDDSDIDNPGIDTECKLSGNSPTAIEKKIEFDISKW